MSEQTPSLPHERDLLLATLDLPTEQRSRFLDEKCGGDLAFRKRIEVLIRNSDTDRSFMAAQAFSLGATTHHDTFVIGSQIGRYKLMEQIGEGGMGVVFVAEQVEPVRRKVALKLIKPGMDSKQVIARFESERQSLAIMDHPNISRVLDAGTTSQGLPYFVMELVRGLPITDYCDQAKLSTVERLALFVSVCSAVQHAHQKGIIHRDIKPNNVLVTLHDGMPVVKVIDFGVAKALNQQLTSNTVYTGLNQMVGTPLYMSPEQFELSGLDIDTRTDVYSLGVLLYELITGEAPFDREQLFKSGFDEMRRIIREVDPLRPSQRISTLSDQLRSTHAARRKIDQRSFARSIQGELDWIALKALEKDRNRRYESASGLAADVRRFLDDEPVLAYPPTWRYRIGKSFRRYRIPFLIASCAFVSLLIGLAIAFSQLRRAIAAEKQTARLLSSAEDQRQHSERQRAVSEKRLKIAEQAVDDMYTQFANDWLSNQAGLSQVQRNFLERAVASYEQLAAMDPTDVQPRIEAIVATLRLGKIYGGLGNLDSAFAAYLSSEQSALLLCKTEPSNSTALLRLAESQVAITRFYSDKKSSAELVEYADKSFATIQAIDVASLKDLTLRRDFVMCLHNLAGALASERKKKKEANEIATLAVAEARSLIESFQDNDDFKLLLSQCYSAQGTQLLWWGEDNEQCVAAYRACLSTLDDLSALRYDSTKVLRAQSTPLNNICVALGRLNQSEEIPQFRQKQIDNYETLVSRFPEIINYKNGLAVALMALAGLEQTSGKVTQANEHRKRAREILTATVRQFPDDRPATVSLIKSLRRFGKEQLTASEHDIAMQTLDEAHTVVRNYRLANPKDFEMYTLEFFVIIDISVAQLKHGNHHKAAELLHALAANTVTLEKVFQSESGELRANNLRVRSSVVFACIAELYQHCAKCAEDDPALSPDQKIEVILKYQRNRDIIRSQLQLRAEQWRSLIANLDDSFREVADLINSSYLVKSREESLSFVYDNGVFERQKVFIKAYVSFIELYEQPPSFWPGIAILLASCPEYPVAPSILVRFCKLALDDDLERLIAYQAYALALLRDDKLEESIMIIESDRVRHLRGSTLILSLAYSLGESKSKAHGLLQEFERTMEANGEKLGSRKPESTKSRDSISNETLDSIHWEVQGLLGTRQTEKADLSPSIE